MTLQQEPPKSTSGQGTPPPGPTGVLARYEQGVIDRITDFNDPRQEWRRLFSELLGTFFLVLVAAGGGMMGQAFPGVISRTAAVVAPALMVMAIILFMGKVSGAHLNPAVSIAFALRRTSPGARARLHRRAADRGDARRPVPARRHQRVVHVRVELPGPRLLGYGRVLDGAHLDHGPGQRDPGHRLGGPEHRHLRRLRRGWLHRPRRAVGQPHLGRLHEPGPHVRARPGGQDLHRLLGLHRRADRRRRLAVGIAFVLGAGVAASPARVRPKVTSSPRCTRRASREGPARLSRAWKSAGSRSSGYLFNPSSARRDAWDVAAPRDVPDWLGKNGRGFLQAAFTHGTGDYGGYSSPATDSIISRALAAESASVGAGLWARAQRQTMSDAAATPSGQPEVADLPLLRSARLQFLVGRPQLRPNQRLVVFIADDTGQVDENLDRPALV